MIQTSLDVYIWSGDKMKRKFFFNLFVLLFLLASLKGIAIVNAPEEGNKISGSFTYETEYIDPNGDEHTGKYSTMMSMEIVDIYKKDINGINITFYRIYVTSKTDKMVMAYLEEGQWGLQEIVVNMESTSYDTFHEPYEDYSPDTIDILNDDPLVGDSGTIKHPFPHQRYYKLEFGVHDPEDYLKEYENEANDIFDDFEEVDWTYDYIDGVTGEDTALEGTAELETSSVELDDLTFKIDYTIASARDRYTFDQGPHNKPNKIDYEFSLTLTYLDKGLLKSFNIVEVYNAGDNGKITYKHSFGVDVNGGSITDFGFGWVTILLIIGMVTIFRQIKMKKLN